MPGYAYNASAIGLGGVIRRGGLTTVVPTVASVCLSPSGGDASVCYENYYRDDISFARAECRVSGTEAPAVRGLRRHITYSEVYLRDLRIFDRIRIAVMQATMTSTREIHGHRPPQELEHDQTEFEIFVLYKGVEIDGSEVAPDVSAHLCSARTYANFADRLLENPELLLPDEDGILPYELEEMKTQHKPFVGSLVKRVNGRFPSKGHKVKLDKFGNVKFGELLVKPDRQRYNLVRFELDADWSGTRQPLPPDGISGEGDPVVAQALGEFNLAMAGSSGSGGGGSLSGAGGGSNGIIVYP